jgi:hypothetical protein
MKFFERNSTAIDFTQLFREYFYFLILFFFLQIIGISDTGVDYNSCFFRDEVIGLPICVGEGVVSTPGCLNQRHRKIVTYVSANREFAAEMIFCIY